MSTTGWLVLGGVALIFAYAIAVLVFEAASNWALNREAERTAAATFVDDFVPEVEDVAAQEAEIDWLIELAHIEDEIEAVLATVRGWSK